MTYLIGSLVAVVVYVLLVVVGLSVPLAVVVGGLVGAGAANLLRPRDRVSESPVRPPDQRD